MEVGKDPKTSRLCLSADKPGASELLPGARGERTSPHPPPRPPPPGPETSGHCGPAPSGPRAVDSASAYFPFLPGAQSARLAPAQCGFPHQPLSCSCGEAKSGPGRGLSPGPQPVSPTLGLLPSASAVSTRSVPGKLGSPGGGECSCQPCSVGYPLGGDVKGLR